MEIRRSYLLAACVAAAVLSTRDARAQAQFVATLDGAQVLPAVSTTATGTARFTIEGDSAIQFEMEVAHLSNVWSAGLYTGASGVSGFKAATLFVGPIGGETNGILARGKITSRDLFALAGLSLPQLTERMKKGEAYVQVLTGTYPAGEIRGTLTPSSSPSG